MKKSIFALALMASVAACGAPVTDAAPAGDVASTETATPALFADLGGEPTGPVYRKAKADTLAVSGFDVVSYFTGEGVPVEGSEEFTVRYEGYDYRFANEDNAKTFIEDPAKYAPAYGGYCAWAIGANDGLAPGDPQIYKIVDGKLYLNFSEDVATRWNKDVPGFIAKGDANYPGHSADEHYQD
ncbi:YHS domain-containing (seleno)protein [Qipengyuania sp. ASV99]|uniref:YHS domain-containing (seleno)protein n=1 Tax=Qipengyuania sp. ASV99 TaxID=3399681 RepID=UPI003A4C5B56